MDKNAIKKYAVWARRELIERVSQKALQYGITAAGKADPNVDSVNGRLLTDAEKKQRKALIRKVTEHGYEQVMEEVAYTWFNRFAALRFMEVNGYLPSHVRVFTNDAGEFKPQILAEAIHLELDGLSMDRVYELKNANKNEELFKYLLVTQCNALSPILPKMFQRIVDDTELLLPDYLLREGSVIHQMIAMIPEEDWRDQVQIIGWLYQYYNTEPKDKVFADLKKNIKITKEDIPAATQLFTPDWIVRYMVENSLGRLWLEGHPNDALKSQWKYYLDEAEQEAEVQAQLDAIRREYAALKPEDIKCIDPCMGSGHILCYLFDVLVQIYEDYGYPTREAVSNIVEKNLWGLDIDDRAAQLAYFAVMMKARQYDRRFFAHPVQPHIYSPKGYPDGEEFGSLLMVKDLEPLPEEPDDVTLFGESYETQLNRWNFRRALSQKYHVVVANPPYMGGSGMGGSLSEYVKKHYPDSKSDLFAVFIERCGQLIGKNGFQAMITQHAWMFLSSYEKLRGKLQAADTVNMAHLGARAFEEIGGEVVQTTSFVMRKSHIKSYQGTYCRLIEPTTQQGKEEMFLAGENRYTAQQDNFSKIPGSPIAYWVSEKCLDIFTQFPLLGDISYPKQGLATSDNGRYLRFWFEVALNNIKFQCVNIKQSQESSATWYPYCKGGEFRKWYGNREYVINWRRNGQDLKSNPKAVIRNPDTYFLSGMSYSDVSTGNFGLRYYGIGFVYDSCGPMIFSSKKCSNENILGALNSVVTNSLYKIVCPTMHFTQSSVAKAPIAIVADTIMCELVRQNIHISHFDWDSYETSWDFKRHPLV